MIEEYRNIMFDNWLGYIMEDDISIFPVDVGEAQVNKKLRSTGDKGFESVSFGFRKQFQQSFSYRYS